MFGTHKLGIYNTAAAVSAERGQEDELAPSNSWSHDVQVQKNNNKRRFGYAESLCNVVKTNK